MSKMEELTQEREIEGILYRVMPVPFAKGMPALTRLIRLVSPMLSAAMLGIGDAGTAAAIFEFIPTILTDVEIKFYSDLFGDAAWYQNEENWVPLVNKGDAQNRNAHFDVRYAAFFRWLMFCMEVNFAGFFTGMGSAVKSAPGVAALLAKLNLKGSTRGSGSDGDSSPTTPTP